MCMGESRDPFSKMGGAGWVGVGFQKKCHGVPLSLKIPCLFYPKTNINLIPAKAPMLEVEGNLVTNFGNFTFTRRKPLCVLSIKRNIPPPSN